MADAGRLPNEPHAPTWGDALRQLPAEAPSASAWPALAARLEARQSRRARRQRILWGSGMALAASIALLAVVPLLRTAPMPTPAPVASPVAVAPDAVVAPIAGPAVEVPRATAPRVASTAPVRDVRRARGSARPAMRTDAARAPSTATTDAIDAPAADPRGLDTLYATSRDLEALLEATRDPRVASGPAAALASEYDATLASIDARLADPALSREETAALWQARVTTLRQATGFETSQRVLAARGDSYDGALVRVD